MTAFTSASKPAPHSLPGRCVTGKERLCTSSGRRTLPVGVRPAGGRGGGRLAVVEASANDPRNSPATSVLREILAAPGIVQAPCAHDALSAKVIERAGFSAAFMSGFCVSATRLGRDVHLSCIRSVFYS